MQTTRRVTTRRLVQRTNHPQKKFSSPIRPRRPGNLFHAVFALLLCCDVTAAATPQAARDTITSSGLRRHVAFLASDTLEGRAAGSQGGRAAAAYLAQQLRLAKLQPGAEDGDFLQPFNNSSQNLLALVPGSDPVLKNEVVLVSGHFDHVGLGNRSNSFGPFGQIHNGADDNASGTAAVLEVAAALASLDRPPRRTVLFALWDGEEAGLLGSSYWLDHPTVTLANLRMMVNCDMVGRLRNNVLVVYGVRTAAGLRRRLAEANVASDLTLNCDWRQREDSDHYPFFQRGIPYLMFHTGDHADYHRPSDDVDKINFEGLESVTRLLFDLTRQIADADALPTFREQSRQELEWHQRQSEQVPSTPTPRLGLSWNADRQPGEPFVVTRVTPGMAASQAGIRVGDRITQFANQSAADIENLVDTVLAAPQQTTALIEREGDAAPLTLAVTLRGNPVRIGVAWRRDDAEPGVAIITTVVPGSPAARVGIEPLDRLLPPLDDSTLTDDWLNRLAEQDEITLRRERRGRLVDLELRPLRPIE